MSGQFNIFFPNKNLNPQGWLTDFITPYIIRTDKNRSEEASIFYDKQFTQQAETRLSNSFKNQQEFNIFKRIRNNVEEEKIVCLNGNHLDILDVDRSLFSNTKETQKYLQFMTSAKPHQLAFLQNYMILSYGVKKKPSDKDYTFYEFPFTQIFDQDFILNDNKSGFPRTEGSGIKSISVSNEFNFVTHVNSKVSINFFFGNLKLLTREIKENGAKADSEKTNREVFPFGFNFMKLFTNFDLSREIIKLEYGKKVSDGFLEYVKDPELKDIIEKREKKVLYLNKINHNFTFESDGKIGLSVTYLDVGRARLLRPNTVYIPCDENKISGYEDYKQILKLYKEQKELLNKAKENILVRQDEIKEAGKIQVLKEQNEKDEKTLTEINNRLVQTRDELRNSFPTIFLDKIKQQGQLFHIDFKTNKDRTKYKANCNIYLIKPTDGKTLKLFEYNTEVDSNSLTPSSSQTDSLLSQIFNTPGNVKESEKNKTFGNFSFFPLRSLISSAYSFLCPEEQKEAPYLLLGNVITNINNKQVSINIGDLLVETQTFQTWYYEHCISKNRGEYSYGAFVTDIFNDLVPRVLFRNNVLNTNSPSSIKLKNYFLDRDGISEQIKKDIYLTDNVDKLREFCKKLSINVGPNNPISLIYASQINSVSSNAQTPFMSNNLKNFRYDEIKDNSRGIMHIKFGADGGIVKNASFSATDNSRIRSAYAYESLANNASKVLLYYYQMSIDLLGNNVFDYDSFVCVPLNALGLESSENDPGLAGYYKVLSTQDRIESNLTYNSSATCTWQFSVEVDKNKSATDTGDLNDNNKVKDFIEASTNDPINYVRNQISVVVEQQTTSNGQPPAQPQTKPQQVANKG